MTRDKRFIIASENEQDHIVDAFTNQQLDTDIICNKLNDLEETRLRKNREIKRFRDREEKYQRVISGVMAFLQLHLNSELWSDWDD